MPSIADSTIAATGTLVQATTSSPTVLAGGSGSMVPVRSALSPADVLDTVTAGVLAGSGVPVQAAWKVTPPASIGRAVAAAPVVIPPPGASTVGGTPQQVTNVVASESIKKMPSGLKSLVSVTFLPFPGDPDYSYAQVWISGYAGVASPQLIASGATSPIEFVAESTNETVILTVVAIGPAGDSALFSAAPTATITLNGVSTAPPAPTISQAVVALAGGIGWQFAWNVLQGLLSDIINGYWVYSSVTNAVTTATRIRYYAQPPSNIGVLTFQDFTSATNYYWVTAVDTTGLESVPTVANTIIVVHSYSPTTVSGGFNNPTRAFDLNETTSADGATRSPTPLHTTESLSETWAGFSTYIGPATAIVLKVMNSRGATYESAFGSSQATANGDVSYSLDSGASWSILNDGPDTFDQQYSEVNLPTTQNLTRVQVMSTSSATSQADPPLLGEIRDSSSITVSLYEIRIEVTQ